MVGARLIPEGDVAVDSVARMMGTTPSGPMRVGWKPATRGLSRGFSLAPRLTMSNIPEARARHATGPAADRSSGATRQGWSKGIGGCDASMKLCLSSSRCESCLAKGEPTRASSKPCADPRDGVGDAQACERAGCGTAAPKPIIFRDAERAGIYRRPQWPLREWARRGSSPAGCSTRARTKRTVQ